MDVELCHKCRSWRVTEIKTDERTRCVCQECAFAWSVSEDGEFGRVEQPLKTEREPAAVTNKLYRVNRAEALTRESTQH